MENTQEMQKLKEQAFLGVVWKGGYQVFHQIASLVVKLVLVRLLLPEDFGLLAMAMIVFTSLDIINRFAVGEPFIRDVSSNTEKAKDTLFILNIIFIGTTILIGFFSAPYVARFFSHKISSAQSITTLMWLIRILTLRLLLSIFAAVPVATLIKDLRFKELYISNIAGSSTFFLTAPVLAFLGLGVWAIALGHIIEQLIITLLFLFFAPYFPKINFDVKIAKDYFKYNSSLFFISIITIIITNGDDTIIGRLIGPETLGFYNISQQFALLAFFFFSSNVIDIIFPVLSKVQHNREQLKNVTFKAFRVIALLAVPFTAGSVMLARAVVMVLFGERWLPIVPAFYILSISTLLTTLVAIAEPVLRSINKPHIVRNCHIIRLIFFGVLIYPFTNTWGYLGVCWVVVILSFVHAVYLMPKLENEINGFFVYFYKSLIAILTATIIMMGCIYLVTLIIETEILSLIVSFAVGIITYGGLVLILDKMAIKDIREVFQLIREKFAFPPRPK